VVLPDVHGELDMQAQASTLTFLLRTALTSGGAKVVPRHQLAQVVNTLLEEKRKYALVVRGSEARRVMLALRAEIMISGEVSRDGSRLTARFLVFRKDAEDEVEKLKRTAPHGQVAELAKEVAKALSKKLRLKKAIKVPDTSMGDLAAFSRAGRAALAGDTKASIEALQAGDPEVASKVPAILEAGRALAEQESVPMPARLDAALFSGNYKLAGRLADTALKKSPRDELAMATKAFVKLQQGSLEEAQALLAKAGRRKRKNLTLLTQAAVANQADNTAERDAKLKRLIRKKYLPALRLIAALEPGALGGRLEKDVLKVAQKNVGNWPGLAASLGLRAARGDVNTEAALDLVRVSLLNTRQVSLLEPLIRQAVQAGWQVGFRLQGEFYLTRGNLKAADNAIVRAVHSNAKDPGAQRLRGYILMEQGDKTAAARAFTAAAASSRGTAEGTRWELYRVLKMNGDRAGAARVKGQLAKKMDLKQVEASSLDLAKEERGWTKSSEDTTITSANKESRLQDSLRPVVNAFPVLAERTGMRVSIAHVRASWWQALYPTRANRELAGEALRQILSSPPYMLRLTDSGPVTESDLTAERLDVLCGNAGTEGLLIYQVVPHLATVKMRLIYYRMVNGEALEYEGTIGSSDAFALGLLTYKVDLLKALGLSVGLFVLIFLIRYLRGTGELIVRIKKDPAARNTVYCIRISRSSRNIDVGDPQTYERSVLATGGKVGRFKATLPASSTEFRRVISGQWYVHVYGTHRKDNKLEVLDGDLSQRVRIRRGGSSTVTFDLEPRDAQLTVHVYDDAKMIQDALVWLDANIRDRVYTDKRGRVTLPLPRGEDHTVHVKVGEEEVTRKVNFDDSAVHHLTINLAKERSVEEVELSKESELDIDKLFDSVPKKTSQPKEDTPAPLTAEEDGIQLVSLDDRKDKVDMGIDYSAVFDDAPKPSAAETVQQVSQQPAQDGKGGAPAGLERYERLEELGRGGMGVVYKARDRVLEREVALKIIGKELKNHPEARKLFLSEAKAMAALNHPNLVIIFDQGWDGDQTFVVMEYVEGETMERLISDKGPPPVGQGLDYFDQLCCGLAFAHSRNIIHRDIKPENVFISGAGSVKLGDFGLAKVAHDMRIKRTEVRGTPMYMAPEQIRGKDIDHRADIYSVGCTAFAMFCGTPPFTEGEVLYHHIHTAPPKPSDVNPNLPPELDKILLGCLAKRKDDRVPSVESLRKSLRPLLARFG